MDKITSYINNYYFHKQACGFPHELDYSIRQREREFGCFTTFRSSTLVDVGAHIGVFSLFGARLGVPVVAVEPVWSSAVRLHAGAAAGGVSGRVKILFHAVTSEVTQVRVRLIIIKNTFPAGSKPLRLLDHNNFHPQLKYKDGNLGGTSVVEVTPDNTDSTHSSGRHELISSITVDSLAPLINTSIIILKTDTGKRFSRLSYMLIVILDMTKTLHSSTFSES